MFHPTKIIKMIKGRRFYFFILLSFLFHAVGIFWISLEKSADLVQAPKKEIRTIVQLIEKKKQQVVDTDDSGEKRPDSHAKFMGKEDMFFKKQTIAKAVGSFKKGQKGAQAALDRLKMNPLSPAASAKLALSSAVNRQQSQQDQAVRSDHIEDIPLGDITQLNTSEYRFYGFLERFKKQMEGHWRLKVREFFEKNAYGRLPASKAQFATDLVISLNSRGQVIDIDVDRSSGVQALDEIAISAIYRAGAFPNPPKEMVVDGKITIPFGFVLN